jgi:hypothetical protein
MDTTLYHPIPTCDIPMPIVEPARGEGRAQLPRILLQAAGTQAASRRVLVMTVIFLAVGVVEGLLLARLPNPEPLVVYHDVPKQILLEPLK